MNPTTSANDANTPYAPLIPETAMFNGKLVTFDQLKAQMNAMMNGIAPRTEAVFSTLNTNIQNRDTSKETSSKK